MQKWNLFAGLLLLFGMMLVSCDGLPAEFPPEGAPTVTVIAPVQGEPTPSVQPAVPPAPEADPGLIGSVNAHNLVLAGQVQGENPHSLKWSRDSSMLAARTSGGISLYDPSSFSLAASYQTSPSQLLLDFSPDTRLAAFTQDQVSLELVDFVSGEKTRTITPPEMINSAVFLPGGSQIATTSSEKWAFTLWDIKNGARGRTYTGFETAAPVYSIQFSQDGKTAIWFARGTVQTTAMDSGEMGAVLSHQDFVGGLDMSPDGIRLAAASAIATGSEPEAIVQLWNAASGEALAEFRGCDIIPMSVHFSPGGELLAADCRGKVLLWSVASRDVASGASGIAASISLMAEINLDVEMVSSVRFSPDGTMLAVAASDGTIRIYAAQP